MSRALVFLHFVIGLVACSDSGPADSYTKPRGLLIEAAEAHACELVLEGHDAPAITFASGVDGVAIHEAPLTAVALVSAEPLPHAVATVADATPDVVVVRCFDAAGAPVTATATLTP